MLVKAGAGAPGEFKWLTPDLDRHDFELKPGADVDAYAAGEIVEINVTAAVDDFSSDESEGEESDTVEATARFMLVERQGDLWRGYLVDTVLAEKAPQLMLLPGRELVVSLRPK